MSHLRICFEKDFSLQKDYTFDFLYSDFSSKKIVICKLLSQETITDDKKKERKIWKRPAY